MDYWRDLASCSRSNPKNQLSQAFQEKAYTPVANQRNDQAGASTYTLDDGTKFGKENELDLKLGAGAHGVAFELQI
jgi:hypothetical protein